MAKKLQINPGDRFGKWTIVKEANRKIVSNKPRRTFECICDCGNIKTVLLEVLLNGHSTSCGCEQKRRASESNLKHGYADKHPLYLKWKNMKKRCNNPKATLYKNYGGRGISVCTEWNDFENFYNWAINNGWKEGLTIERRDVNGNYCPENCTWETIKVQANNKTDNHYINYNGVIYTLTTLSEALNIPYNIVRYRISRCHWNVEQLITYWNDRN